MSLLKEEYEALNSSELDEILKNGVEKTRKIAEKKVIEVKNKIGFYE